MALDPNNLSDSQNLAARLIFVAMKVISENDGNLQSKKVMEEVEKREKFNEWESAPYKKSGYIRWKSILHFYSIDCVKAGFLVKKKGVWYITPEGEKALELGKEELLITVVNAYKDWKKSNKQMGTNNDVLEEDEAEIGLNPEATIDQAEQVAIDGIKQFIAKKNPYEFQDLVAALLRGMGYYTPFVAPKGKDGGVDILAYRDPFGIEAPRIKVQVKHRENAASVKEVRELMGILQKIGDVGIFVSAGGFTSEAKSMVVNAQVHVELIDLDSFINLWHEFFKKLSDEDKSLLPLIPVYFLSPTE